MVLDDSPVVLLVSLVDRIPLAPPPARRGRPPVYSPRLFLKALVVMVLKQAPTAHALAQGAHGPARPADAGNAAAAAAVRWRAPPVAARQGTPVAPRRDPYPHDDPGVAVHRVLHEERSAAIEHVNGQFKAIFDVGGQDTPRPCCRRALGVERPCCLPTCPVHPPRTRPRPPRGPRPLPQGGVRIYDQASVSSSACSLP